MTPSPENPVEIESFKCTKFNSTNNLLTVLNVGVPNAYINSSGAIRPDETWLISKYFEIPVNAQKVLLHVAGDVPAVCFYDINKDYITGMAYGNQIDITLTIPDGAKLMRFSFPAASNESSKVVFDDGISSTCEKLIVLHSLPDGTCDEYKDGKIIRRVGRIVLDGSGDEDWTKQSDNDVIRYFVTVNGMKKLNVYYGSLICDRLRTLNNHTHYDTEIPSISGYADFQNVYPNQNWIYVLGIGDANIRTWLQEHPLEVLYPLAEPTIESVSIPILPSQHPYTQVYTDSPVDTDIEWEILTSSNNDAQIDDLIARVTALESVALE